ncbi:MAG: ABC-2 family transporter protein [Candidatus Nanohaloarchaea archaeon]|nr:ABC-2 family transporter protein [Candidatus Nanohaloarchaea archaeon]
MREYVALARIGFREATAYRFDAVMSLVTSLLYLVMVYAIWNSIAAAGQLAGGISTVLTYIVVGQIVSNSVFVSVEEMIGERVREGTIVNELKRPITLRAHAYFYQLGQALFRFLSRGLPVGVIAWLAIGLPMPSPVNVALFGISLFLGFNLVFALSFMTSMAVFWTEVHWSIRMMRNIVQNLFSGVLFPLYLLPEHLKTVFYALPFHAMVDGPISIFTMEATGFEALRVLGVQLVWMAVLLLLGEAVWRYARKHLTVQGG